MDSLFHDADDEADDAGADSAPSVEAIVDAFREASGRTEGPSSSPSRPSPSAAEESFSDEPGASASPVDVLRDTLAAFRKTKRRADDAPRDEERTVSDAEEESRPSPAPAPSSEDEEGTRSADAEAAAADERPEAEESPAAGDEEDGEEDTGYEDFGAAFRKALSERGEAALNFAEEFDPPNGDDASDASAEEDDEATDDASDGAPTEPPARSGDSVPASEDLEMTAGSASEESPSTESTPPPRAPEQITEFPKRPSESFLWVTDGPADETGVVSVENLGETEVKEADAFLLYGGGRRPYDLLTRIRSHSEMGVYLKPVFWRHAEGQRSPVAAHVDGKWAQDQEEVFRSLQGQANSINQRISNLIDVEGRESGGVELRVLRFMATRNHEFTPQRTVENSDGFVYPKLTPILDRGSRGGGGELTQVLTMLEDRRLLTGEFMMRQHACRNCGTAFLNFEEMCPHCSATDIDADDLVHHFRCAFTGALSEYKKEEGKLVCPKCDRKLKQIGVDYDKPSVVYTCRRCHEQFQDPEVQTTCYRCEHTNPPEQQVERQIKEYEVTALGEETASYGLSDSLLSILERESRVLDYATFQLIVESEAARIERYQRSTSCLLLVRVSGLKQLRTELGERSEEVIGEIATAFDNTLRSSDYLSARDESLYLFLLTETDQSGARRAGERLEENIEGVLGQNLQHPPELDIAVQPVRPSVDLDDLAERFLSTRTRAPAAVNER